jgi:hypothetical protein
MKKMKKGQFGKNALFTHNCGARMVCGRIEATPSMMALNSTLGTTIDGSHKGAGITKMQGEVTRVQYYFEKQEWIVNTYFKQRGLDALGYQEDRAEESEIELSGDIDLDNMNSTTTIEFDDQKAEIDNRKDQKFEEI